jgi:hypothetical protein
MDHIAFSWAETHSLSAELKTDVVRATLGSLVDFPHVLTLWRADGTGLQISSRMHDIAERLEIGVLEFALVAAEMKEPKRSVTGVRQLSFAKVDLPTSFHNNNHVTKLVISEAGTTADSGILITAADGNEIVIVAGVMPYSLAIRGIFSAPRIFQPEYDLKCYERVEIA